MKNKTLKFLLRLIIKLYSYTNRDITKLSVEDEYEALLFDDTDKSELLLKSILTAQTLWYWEAKTKAERTEVRGATKIIKILLDAHRKAIDIKIDSIDKNEAIEKWKTYKKRNRTN